MINIVHALFRNDGLRCNTVAQRGLASMLVLLAAVPPLIPHPASATFRPLATSTVPSPALPVADTRYAAPCALRGDCPGRRPPGAPDRDARPFGGTLGQPCAYRTRFTPSGPRRVRVCF